jgi:hypothetical protein
MNRRLALLATIGALGLTSASGAQSPSPAASPSPQASTAAPGPAGMGTRPVSTVKYKPMSPAVQIAVQTYLRLLLDKTATQKSLAETRAKVEGLLSH